MDAQAASTTSLHQLAKILGISQPFLSQIRAGNHPVPATLKRKRDALDAYHLPIGDKRAEGARIGGNDRIRTYDLALMKRPLCR
jgi:transcriptional regulator with XRE-family HTH domain